MAGPYFHNDKLLVVDSKIAMDVKCCCCNVVIIAIYNANCAKDDNFDVTLNGTSLGSIDNSQHKCTGRLFYAAIIPDTGPGPTRDNTDSQCGGPVVCSCAGSDFETSLTFDKDLLITGTNSLRAESTNNANNGNFGHMKVVCARWDGTCYVIQKTLLNSTYGHADGPPNGTTRTFTYP